MKSFHILSVGIVLATALCSPAKALDFQLESPIWNLSSEVQKFEVPRVYTVTPEDTKAAYLTMVYEVASGYKHPEVLQAILLQESNGGTHPTLIGSPNAHPDKRSYGVMQVTLKTARSLLERYAYLRDAYFPERPMSEVADREIKTLLLRNHRANIEIAAALFDLYLSTSNGDVNRAIAAYNVGIGGVKRLKNPASFRYVKEVRHKIQTVVIPFNETYNLKKLQTVARSIVLTYNK